MDNAMSCRRAAASGRGRWKFALVMGCLFLVVGGIPLLWLQAHGWR